MRTLFWFIYFWISLVFLIPAMIHAKQLFKSGKTQAHDKLVNTCVRGWMSSLLRLAGVSVQVSGLENIPDTPVVFVSNHQGNFDIPILLCHLDRVHGIIAKIELQKLPLIRTWMKHFGCVFIDRKNPRQSAASLNQAAQQLVEGRSMIIFPEGTRSRSDAVGEFKPGGFKTAYKAKVPVVPVCIDGSYQAMEANRMWIKPASVKLTILPPIETASMDKEQFRTLPQAIREQIIAEKSRLS